MSCLAVDGDLADWSIEMNTYYLIGIFIRPDGNQAPFTCSFLSVILSSIRRRAKLL